MYIYIIGVDVRTREALLADYADDLARSDSDLASVVGHGDEGSDVEVVCRDSKQNEVRVAVGIYIYRWAMICKLGNEGGLVAEAKGWVFTLVFHRCVSTCWFTPRTHGMPTGR